MQEYVADLLACPLCRGALHWTVARRERGRIEEAEARCAACGATYPVRDGVGVFLPAEASPDDLWEQVESGLMHHLRAHPDLMRQLMDAPLDALNPADQFFRAMVLEERGAFAEARQVADLAHSRLYTPGYRACHTSQRRYVVERLAGATGPVIDLASGRGDLVMVLAAELTRPLVATDVSPRVLRMDRRRLEALGLYERVSLLACDARRMPFRDGALATMTTNLGLPNIVDPDALLRELRRVVSGTLLAISYFFPAGDAANVAAASAAAGSTLLLREPALAAFAAAGWRAQLENRCTSPALPTPRGQVLEGAGIDGLPVAATTLEWGVLVAQ